MADGAFDLSRLNGSDGFIINGTNPFDALGAQSLAMGDFDGDGNPDLGIGFGVYSFYPSGVYVFWGGNQTYPMLINVSTLDSNLGVTFYGTVNGLTASTIIFTALFKLSWSSTYAILIWFFGAVVRSRAPTLAHGPLSKPAAGFSAAG